MSTKKSMVANATFSKITELANQRAVWQAEFFDKSNAGLYKLLADCLGLYYEIKGSSTEKLILDAMKNALNSQNIKVQKSTPVLTLLVKFVFKAERRRAYAYSRVLRIAAQEPVPSEKFADWVKNFGGIEEVVSKKGLSDEILLKRTKLEAKVEEVKQMLLTQIQTPLAVAPKTALVNAADTGEYTLLIGKMQANGETKVLSVVPDTTDSMVDTAIKKIAASLLSRIEQQKREIDKAEAAKALEQAANKAEFAQAA